jgi:hypothetical protein
MTLPVTGLFEVSRPYDDGPPAPSGERTIL